MSCLTKSQLKYLGNSNEKEKFYFTHKDENNKDFDFQYVPVSQFKHIIKDVKRQRTRNEEERVWTSFLKQQEDSSLNYKQSAIESQCRSSRTLAESLKEVDKELMQLEANTISETQILIGNNSNRETEDRSNSAKSKRKDSPIVKDNETGSTNFLLTIPEEEHAYCLTESSESCKQCPTFIRKSYSDNKLEIKKNHSSYCYYSTNDLDYNSSPGISPDGLSIENDSISLQPDPTAVSKILGIQKKISTVLDSISYELDRIPLPDGENDLHRRQQRVAEFSTRLSRNYLYDLGRQIFDIQRHIKAITPNSKIKLSRRGTVLHMQAVEQKLISVHQLLLAALNAYWKHIPSSVLINHPGKLKEILQIVVQLKNICNDIKLTPELHSSGDNGNVFLGKETENRCSIILSKFRLVSDNESQVPSHTTKSTVLTSSRSRKQRNRKLLSNRLSMYTMDLRLAKTYQPKRCCSMFQIPRDRRQNYMMSKQQQNNDLMVSKKSQLSPIIKTSNEAIANKTTKISIPLKEDDIQTMMETIPSDLDLESPRSLKSSKKLGNFERYQKSIELNEYTKEYERLNKKSLINSIVNKKHTKDNSTKEKDFSSFLPVIGDLLFVQNKQNYSKLLPLNSVDNIYDFVSKDPQNMDLNKLNYSYHVEHENESGAKNARLICYSSKENKEKSQLVDVCAKDAVIKYKDASCQANPLKNNGLIDLFISESTKQSVLEYRNQYQDFMKSNPMYTSNTQNKPWEVVAWIADKLVDEIVVELSNDLQMEDVIQKLFELEFQEF